MPEAVALQNPGVELKGETKSINMNWLWLAIPVVVLLVLIAVLGLVLRRTGGYAPGWMMRCASCGYTRPAAEAGMVRVGAASWKKYTLGRCTRCNRFRIFAIER